MQKASWEQSTGSTKTSRKCEPNWLSTKIRMLFSSYRMDQYADPDGFLSQMGIVLAEFDPQIVAIVTSPLTGIQRKSEFPPTIAKVVEECNRVAAELAAEEIRRREPKRIAERVSHSPIPEGMDYDSMFAKYGRPIGFFEQ